MVIRQLYLRHGRRAIAKPAGHAWRRALASATEQQTSFNQPSAATLGNPEEAAAATQVQLMQEPEMAAFATQYWESEAFKKRTRRIGGTPIAQYEPHMLVNHPPSPQDITLELLMASQAHLGHAAGLWHPGNARYIYGIRDGIHIISLDATASHLRRACKIVEATALEGGLILFVGTRSGQERSVIKAAELAGGCHVFDRWIPGSITNRIQILGKCRTKVIDQHDEEIPGFESQLGKECPLKPDLVVCLNPLENHVLLRECNQHHIPTIGVVDTDCNPALVTYPIPANDDSRRCTNVIAGVLGRAAQSGRSMRLDYAGQTGKATYHAREDLSRNLVVEGEEGETEGVEGQSQELAEEDGNVLEPAEGTDAANDYTAISRVEKVRAALEMYNLSDQEENASDLLGGEEESSPKLKTTFDSDPVLERLVAMKRRALGEELSSRDKELLKVVETGEAAIRAQVEKGREDLLRQAGKAQEELKAQLAESAAKGGAQVVEERDGRARERARREERVPFTKTRRGRA